MVSPYPAKKAPSYLNYYRLKMVRASNFPKNCYIFWASEFGL